MGRAGPFALVQIPLVALMRGAELLTGVHEFARHSLHKAQDDFPRKGKALELGYEHFIYIRDGKSSKVDL
jgi:hypothetical protein